MNFLKDISENNNIILTYFQIKLAIINFLFNFVYTLFLKGLRHETSSEGYLS